MCGRNLVTARLSAAGGVANCTRCANGRLQTLELPAWLCFCCAAHPEIWVLIFARGHDLRINLRQSLGGPTPLWCPCYNRSDAIHYDPNAHIGTVGNKTRLCAYRSDLGAGSLRPRLNGWRFGGCRLGRRCGRGLNGLGRCRASTEFIEQKVWT